MKYVFALLVLVLNLAACGGDNSDSGNTQEHILLAVDGKGYLVFETEENSEVYSRSAELRLNSTNTIVNSEGEALYVYSPPDVGIPVTIQVSPFLFSNLVIDSEGILFSSDDPDTEIARLVLVTFSSRTQLLEVREGVFEETFESGNPRISAPSLGTGGDILLGSDTPSVLDDFWTLTSSESYFVLGEPESPQFSNDIELFVDSEHFITDAAGNRLLMHPESSWDGFARVDEEVIDTSVMAPVQIQLSNLDPKRTTQLDLTFSLQNNTTIDMAFDPLNPDSYNDVISLSIWDSLGTEHELSIFLINISNVGDGETTHHWQLIPMVDGVDVGDPDTTLPPPNNSLATRATFNIFFDGSGAFSQLQSDHVLISNWVPLDENGSPNGADGPLNILEGASYIFDHEIPLSSNFIIPLSGSVSDATTQISFEQNGYGATRADTGLIDSCGRIHVQYLRDVELVIGQLPLAQFSQPDQLTLSGTGLLIASEASGAPNFVTACSESISDITPEDIDF